MLASLLTVDLGPNTLMPTPSAPAIRTTPLTNHPDTPTPPEDIYLRAMPLYLVQSLITLAVRAGPVCVRPPSAKDGSYAKLVP
jgi:hypothetical protein